MLRIWKTQARTSLTSFGPRLSDVARVGIQNRTTRLKGDWALWLVRLPCHPEWTHHKLVCVRHFWNTCNIYTQWMWLVALSRVVRSGQCELVLPATLQRETTECLGSVSYTDFMPLRSVFLCQLNLSVVYCILVKRTAIVSWSIPCKNHLAFTQKSRRKYFYRWWCIWDKYIMTLNCHVHRH